MKFLLRLPQHTSLIALALASSACGVIQAIKPTINVSEVQTSVFLTIQAEVTLNATPVISTPIFTAAPTSTEVSPADYPSVVVSRFQTLQSSFVEFIEIHNQLTANPNMSRN